MIYKKCKLGDIADVISGYAFKTNDFVQEGVGVIKIKNITPPNISNNDMQCVTEGLVENLQKYKVRFNDILISMTGSNVNQFASAVGKVGRLRDKNNYYMLNQRVGKIVIKDNNVYNYDFLYHFLTQTSVKWELASSAGGSANQANISPKQIKDVNVPLPVIDIQNDIANILNSIDDKIELNNQINDNLQSMSQLLFKKWFEDFNFPNEEGLSYKSSGGDMINSEVGMIPKGWEVKSLYDFAIFINGTSFKRDELFDDGLPIIKIAELKEGISKGTRYFKGTKDEKYILKNGDILFSWSGNPDTSIDMFLWYRGKAILNQHIFKVVVENNQEYSFVYLLLKYFKPQFAEIARNKQTTGLGHVTINDLKRLKFIYSEEVIIRFNQLVNGLILNQLLNYKENLSLSNLRDTLLPKLMNGEINLDNLEINL